MLQKIVSHVSMQENHINIVRMNTYHQKLCIELMGENVFEFGRNKMFGADQVFIGYLISTSSFFKIYKRIHISTTSISKVFLSDGKRKNAILC